MHAMRRDRVGAGVVGRALALLLVVALGALVVAGLSACGGTSVSGTYAFDSGSEEGMEGFTLTLNDDETFVLSQPAPEGGEDIGINGTYTVDGDKISLKNEDGSESEAGTIDGDKLVFETVTWAKQ
jgi:hypothetical protein